MNNSHEHVPNHAHAGIFLDCSMSMHVLDFLTDHLSDSQYKPQPKQPLNHTNYSWQY